MRYLLRRLLRTVASVMITGALWGMLAPAWAADINRDLLKRGMTLNEVVVTFGQPAQMEWVNLKGTAVLFIFYPTDKSDAVFKQDGSMWLPLGFVTELLAGWGKEFYEEVRFPKGAEPSSP